MESKPDFNRILKAIRHEESDRVPLCELLIDYPHQSRFLNREITPDDIASQIEFWSKAGYDFIPITVGMLSPGKVTKESPIVKIIRETMLKDSPDAENERSWNIELGDKSFINSRADLERFPWDLAGQLEFTALENAGNLLPEGMKVIAMSGKIFTLTWMLMGFNHFSMSLILDENLVGDVFKKVAEIQLNALDRILSLKHVGAVWMADDIAFGTGPMISPKALKDHVFPWYAQVAKKCHAKGLPLILHSDGDMKKLIPDLIELGLDALHPIDPNCMDIREIKLQYGRDLCLIGNVSNELLRSGRPEEVRANVKKLLKEIAPGGGFCIGSGNSVPDWASFENFMAMREAALSHGQYPISLP
jgi:uroporphyrinogen decarboxylase